MKVTKQFIVTHCLSVVYYETKNEESTLLEDTGLVVELEHLKIKTRLMDDKFASATVRGECEQGNSLCFYYAFNVGVG